MCGLAARASATADCSGACGEGSSIPLGSHASYSRCSYRHVPFLSVQCHEFDELRFDVRVYDCTYFLRAPSVQEKQQWIEVIEANKVRCVCVCVCTHVHVCVCV